MKKIVSDARYSSNASGGGLTYTIELGPVGDKNKQLLVMIVVKQSSGANVRMFTGLTHGPNGFLFTAHSNLIGTGGAPIAINADNLMVGQSDDTLMLGSYLNLGVELSDSAASSEQWVVVDVYTSLKPF